ncbi:MAG: hypothetical protein ABI112_00840 [Terracoccus sp.]
MHYGQRLGTFVDPLSLGWFQGDARSYVGPDGEHPNLSGEQYLATKMIEILDPEIAAPKLGLMTASGSLSSSSVSRRRVVRNGNSASQQTSPGITNPMHH